jgi:hypothetical protein
MRALSKVAESKGKESSKGGKAGRAREEQLTRNIHSVLTQVVMPTKEEELGDSWCVAGHQT